MRVESEQEFLARLVALNPPKRKVPLASVVRLVARPLSIEAERESLLHREAGLIDAEKVTGDAGAMYLYHAMQERLHAEAKEFARRLRNGG
jgi:hypothetical protein